MGGGGVREFQETLWFTSDSSSFCYYFTLHLTHVQMYMYPVFVNNIKYIKDTCLRSDCVVNKICLVNPEILLLIKTK